MRLHDTRHTSCSVMLLAGESPYVVAKLLGHSSDRMVSEVYRHLMGDELERAGQAASALLLTPRRDKSVTSGRARSLGKPKGAGQTVGLAGFEPATS